MDTKELDGEEMPIAGYDPMLAAQVAAVLLLRGGGSMDKLKLVKLLYLVERESVVQEGRPMFFDENFSLKDGPAGTNALSGIDGLSDGPTWSRYVRLDGRRDVHVREGLVEDDFDHVSDTNLAIIERVHEKFGKMETYAIREWTHKYLPEYVERYEGREKIQDAVLAKAIGIEDPERYVQRVKGLREPVWGKLT